MADKKKADNEILQKKDNELKQKKTGKFFNDLKVLRYHNCKYNWKIY